MHVGCFLPTSLAENMDGKWTQNLSRHLSSLPSNMVHRYISLILSMTQDVEQNGKSISWLFTLEGRQDILLLCSGQNQAPGSF